MSVDKQIIVWDPKTYERLSSVHDLERMYRPEDTFTCMAWDDKLKRLLVAHSRLQSWPYRGDAKEGLGLVTHKTKILGGLYNSVYSVVLTVDDSGLVIVWRLDTGEQLAVWSIKHEENERISTVSFDRSERRLLVGTTQGRVWIYNWNSGVRLNELESNMDCEVSCVLNTMSAAKAMDVARGNTVATGWNKLVYIWNDPPDNYALKPIRTIDLHSDCDVRYMTWIQETKMIAFAMYNGAVNTWLTSGNWKRMFKIENQGKPIQLNTTVHHSLRSNSGMLTAVNDQLDANEDRKLKDIDEAHFLDTDQHAINAISSLNSLPGTQHPVYITGRNSQMSAL